MTLTIKEAAERKGVSPQMILRYIKRKTSPLKARRNEQLGTWEIDSVVLDRFRPMEAGRPRNGKGKKPGPNGGKR